MTSLWWQYSRSEDTKRSSKNFFTFYATPSEAESKQFNLRYSCAADTYERLQQNAITGQLDVVHSYSKWQTCVYSWEHLARKEEHDHRMVYLSKADVNNAHRIVGLIEWKFDFSNQGLKMKSVDLTFGKMLYRDGKVNVDIIHDGRRIPTLDGLQSLDSFTIRAKLKGSKGDVVYQNAQIFRQRIADFGISIRIEDYILLKKFYGRIRSELKIKL